MSVYERRYNVYSNQVSHYTDDPREALRLLDSDPEQGWVAEGYADYEDVYPGHRQYGVIAGRIVTRRTTGPVSRPTLLARITALEFREQRAAVQAMIKRLRGAS